MTYTAKDKVRCMICTSLYRIEADMYVLPGSRLTDLLNVKSKDFIPVTQAVFYHPYESKIFAKVDFALVSRDSILMMFPVEGSAPSDPGGT